MFDYEEDQRTDEEKLADSEAYGQEVFERLQNFIGETKRWVMLDRNAILEKVIGGVISTLKKTDSPEPIEGIENGFDFMGIILTEGSDNMLCELSYDMVRDEIRHRISELERDEKTVLLLPYCDTRDLSDLIRDVEVERWSACLFSECEYIWLKPLMDEVLYRIPERYRHDD